MKKTVLSVRFSFCLLVCFLLTQGSGLAFLAAAAVHEAGHILAAVLLDGELERIELGILGIAITKNTLPFKKESVILIAGPLAGFALCFAAFVLNAPELFKISLYFSLFNLLPINPLDGWRILYETVCAKRGYAAAERACYAVGTLTLAVLSCAAAFFALKFKSWRIAALLLFSVAAAIKNTR